jgi:hypothetical protein
MRKLSWLTMWVCSFLVTVPVCGSEISSFVVPYGYRAPLLEKGDFAVNLFHYYDTKDSEKDHFDAMGDFGWERNEKMRYFSLNGAYAVTGGLILQGSFDFHPDQVITTYRRTTDFSSWDFQSKNRSDFAIAPSLGVSFRPKMNMEFYGSFHYRKEELHVTMDYMPGESQFTNRTLNLEFGATVLGRDFLGVLAPVSRSEVRRFSTVYGFRSPVISQGWSGLSVGYQYRRTKSEHRWSEARAYDWETVEKRYHFFLDGLHALTDWLILQGRLELYPGQDRKDYPGYVYAHGDFMYAAPPTTSELSLSPHFNLSFRPKGWFEFYGNFYFLREKFNFDARMVPDEYLDERRELYRFDFGFSVLGSFMRRTRPDLSSDLCDFLIPYGFRTPMLRQGQYALNLNYHNGRSESEGPNPPASGYSLETTEKMYYLSLIGACAAFDWLVFEAGVDFCPAQDRATYRTIVEGHTTWYLLDEKSDFAMFPGLVVSIRPRLNLELFGGLSRTDEKLHSDGDYVLYPGWETEERDRREGLRFDFGLTVLGVPW